MGSEIFIQNWLRAESNASTAFAHACHLQAADLIDTQATEIERLGKLIDSKELIALCPKCNTTYIDHDGFGCCGCDDPEAKQLRVPPVPSITYKDGRIKQASLHGWWITARHHKGETWVEIKPAAQETTSDD